MNKKLDRLNAVIELLKFQDVIHNQSDIARHLGYNRPGTISEIVNGKIPLTTKFLHAFCNYYGVNKDYIEKGAGEVFLPGSEFSKGSVGAFIKQKMQAENESKALAEEDDNWRGVPMYDIPVSAGAVTLIRDEVAPTPAYYLQIPGFKDCTFGARVSGDSMYPEIRNGDYVICKEIQSMGDIIYGDIYLIVTHSGMETVKYLHPHDEKADWIKLVPYNKSVPPTAMPKSNIFKVYKVKGVLKGY